jgi:MFS transporter, Spinster family, sphingosine-1-phosphate transporter
MKRYGWVIVALLWVIWLLNYLDRQVIFSLFPLIKADLRLTDFELGLAGTAFLWVYAAASPFAGYLADRIGRKRMVVASLVVWSAVTWLTGQARTLPELLAARALMGISEACYLPAGLALIAAWHGEKTRAKATAVHYSGLYLGMVIGGGLGGWLGAHYGWRMAFTALGAVGLAYAVVAAAGLRDGPLPARPAKQRGFLAATAAVFRLPGYPAMFAVFGTLSLANWVVYTWLPLYLYERFDMTLAEAGLAATLYLQAGSLAGVALGGWLGDLRSGTGATGRWRLQAAGLAAGAPFLILAGWTGSTLVLFAGMAAFGIGRGIFDANAMPALAQIAPDELRSTGFGLFNLIGPLAGGLIAAAAGALKTSVGIGGTIQIAGAILLASSVLLARNQAATTDTFAGSSS